MYQIICAGCGNKIRPEDIYAYFMKEGKKQFLCRDCCKRKVKAFQTMSLLGTNHNGHEKKD